MSDEESRDLALEVSFSFLGKPYVWGGDNPEDGFDCSGLVIECLKSVGILPRVGDWTADELYRRFKREGLEPLLPKKGCLVFWESAAGGQMVHVELCSNDKLSIGASGGGSKTLTVADAIRQDAHVKVRPWVSRGGGKVHFVDPFL